MWVTQGTEDEEAVLMKKVSPRMKAARERSRKRRQEKFDLNKLYFQGPRTLNAYRSGGKRNFILPSMMTKSDKEQLKILRGK